MGAYQSRFSGANIDRAVAYFNAIQQAGRVIITVPISTGDWQNSQADTEDIKHGTKYVDVTTSGVNNIEGAFPATMDKPPQVYFVQSEPVGSVGEKGQKWDIEYRIVDSVSGSTTSNTIRCYSNISMSGSIIIVTVLSALPVGDGSYDGDLYINGNIYQNGVLIQNI